MKNRSVLSLKNVRGFYTNVKKSGVIETIQLGGYFLKRRAIRRSCFDWIPHKYMHKITGLISHMPHKSDSNVLEYHYISPDKINLRTKEKFRIGEVFSEEIETEPFESSDKYKMFYEVFVENKSWFETERVTYYQEAIADPEHRYTGDINEKIKEWDHLYHSIKNEGYKTQIELKKEGNIDSQCWSGEHLHWCFNEVQTVIGPNGAFVWKGGGNHRLAIAKILDLDRIPVIIKARHVDWEEKQRT